MATMTKLVLFLFAALVFAGCTPPATNTNVANTNTNTAPAPPSAATLLALENQAVNAWKDKNTAFFDNFLSSDFVSFSPDGKRTGKADLLKYMSEDKCTFTSFTLSEPHVVPLGANAAVLTTKVNADVTCNGKKEPPNGVAASVYVRSGDTWKGMYHEEVVVAEMPAAGGNSNTAAPANTAPANTASNMNTASTPAAANTANTANTMASNTAANSNSNANTAGTADSLTTELLAIERRGWEAWKNQNKPGLEADLLTSLTLVDGAGRIYKTRTDAVNSWTNPPCTISSFELSDAVAVPIGADAALLHVKGTSVGTCGTQKTMPIWNTTIFVKEGGVWKAAYIFQKPV